MLLIRTLCSEALLGEAEKRNGMLANEHHEAEIVSALRRIVRAIDLRSRRLFEQSGLTGPQLLVLREASRLSGASISALARGVDLSQPTVSGIIDRLERRGMVRRARGTGDRRTVMVAVTPEGGRTLRDAPSLLQDRFRSELARLKEWEQTQLLATLQRVAAMMNAEEIDAAPVLATGPIDAIEVLESGESAAADGAAASPTEAQAFINAGDPSETRDGRVG
jgi:DNA-binding MarR family transcriptional regulator